MKKKTSILTAALLLTMITFIVFAGGSGQRESVETLAEVGFRETGLPIVTRPYSIRAIGSSHSSTPPWENLEIFQILERVTGIHIEWVQYAGADWATQRNLIFASGDLPEIFFGRGILDESQVILNREAFLPLNDLIARYGHNLQAVFRDDPNMERLARAYDGTIYGLPQKMPYRPVTNQAWGINTIWLERLNLQMPTTTEELYNVLRAFKERDPNRNGLADEIPASFLGGNHGGNRGIENFFGPFGVVPSGGDWLNVTNGRVNFIVTLEGFRDATAYLHRLYSEGLLDVELFTQTSSMLAAKVNPAEGQPEIVGLSGQWGRNYHFGPERSEHYALVMPLRGPRGHQQWAYSPESNQYGRYAYMITTRARHPEIAMRLGDALYEQTMSLNLYHGPEGLAWRYNAAGNVEMLEPTPGFQGDWGWGIAINDRAPGYTSDRMSSQYVWLGSGAHNAQHIADKQNFEPYFPTEWWPQTHMISFTANELAELALLTQDIVGPSRTRFAEWVTRGGVEQEWEAWVRQINNMGLPRMLAIYQAAYDRYMGR